MRQKEIRITFSVNDTAKIAENEDELLRMLFKFCEAAEEYNKQVSTS